MNLKKYLRPVDLARSVELSAQTVRDYEHWGFIPPAERGAQGYRHYGSLHLHAIRTARAMIAGFGWERALKIMRCVHQNELSSALIEIDAHHAAVHNSRRELEQTLIILHEVSASPLSLDETSNDTKQVTQIAIGQAAQRVGVRVSTLRFWEEQGLIHPTRAHPSNYRLYDTEHVRQLQIIALLRKVGYDLEVIRTVLAQLATGAAEQALAAAEHRLQELMETSRRSVEATAILWAYIEERDRLRS